MANVLRFEKVAALPGVLTASTVYFVPDADGTHLVMYLTDSTGSAAKKVPTMADIQAAVAAAGGGNPTVIVADITARNALAPTQVETVLVLDASADTTVNSGAATYIYDSATTTWYKISEAESMDVILQWANIVGGPTSTPAQIDQAVTDMHTHTNMTVLNALADNGAGFLEYNAAVIPTYLATESW